ncbi:MAG: signal peptidase II [Proteobacteria bacterium]|nr:signal peptidase II [Alphaproteobacteria bacterium]MDA1180929.1 signal peptidase II [Pseudomonadota bacterium]
MRKILIFLLLVLFDILSKYIVFNYIDLYQFIKITYFFDITHIHNFGVSFGLFAGTIPALVLVIIGLFVTAFVLYLYINSSEFLERWGLFIIICGAIGNIVDRFINGYVIDFLYFHINQYYWPAFNFADIYISIGIIMIIVNMVKKIIKS